MTVSATRTLIRSQKQLYLEDPKVIFKTRMHSTPSSSGSTTARPRYNASIPHAGSNNRLAVPPEITLKTLEDILDPLLTEIALYEQRNSSANANTKKAKTKTDYEALRSPGSSVLVYWTKEEIGKTGWKTGWYKGTLKLYEEKTDMIEVEFKKEKGAFYKYLVVDEVAENRLKLAKNTERTLRTYEEIMQIGTLVEMKWSKDELVNTD